MNFPRITSNYNPTFASRHPILTAIVAIPSLTLAVIISVMMGVGAAQAMGSNQGPGQITIQKTADQYHDCMTFATADHFAPDVCEPLSTNSQSAILSCASEVAYGMQQVDCPKR